MISLKRRSLKPVKAPDNLRPLIFKCLDCNCTVRYLEVTDSFVLASTPKNFKEKDLCPFCLKLYNYRGIEE